ncbi:hypothetical protein AX15_006630 [Amanita polypyramis BW_CC]|nr:hypothetical protein AX15_006630 [Amanita polypyramis BW_CC]
MGTCIYWGQLFRVHSYFFERDSTKFLPAPTCEHVSHTRGGSDETPITVDVDPVKFEKLLWVFYNPTYSLYDASAQDWSDILELAHQWSFMQVKRLAIRELQKISMPTVNRIALYQKYSVDCEFLVPLYAELCMRPDILRLEEASLISMPTAIVIFQLREEFRTRSSPPPSDPLPNGMTQAELHVRIAAAFGFPADAANRDQGARAPPAEDRLSIRTVVRRTRVDVETGDPELSAVRSVANHSPQAEPQGTVASQ